MTVVDEIARPSGPDDAKLLPASAEQRQFWLLQQLDPAAGAYHVAGAVRLKGSLDHDALRGALCDCVSRHEVLRTALVAFDGVPWQRIVSAAEPFVGTRSLAHLPRQARQAAALEEAQEFARASFDLAQAPLIRALLMTLGAQDAILVVCAHHAACDGWSLEPLLADLRACYAARRGAPAPPPPALQYADLSAVEAQVPSPEASAYWRKALAGASPLVLPGSPSMGAAPVGVEAFALDPQEARALGRRARAVAATPAMALLCAFALLLRRLSGSDDILLGSPVARRHQPRLTDVVGPIGATAPLRLRLDAGVDVDAALAEARAAVLGALSRLEFALSAETILQDAGLERRGPRASAFEALFAMQPNLSSTLSLEGVETEFLPLPPSAPKAALILEFAERSDGGLEARLEYDAARFEAAEAAQWADALRVTLLRLAVSWSGPAEALVPMLNTRRAAAAAVALVTTSAESPLWTDVAVVWREILGAPPRPEDDFFAFGSSLQAARFAVRLGKRLGCEVPLAYLFRHPTAGALSAALSAALSVQTPSEETQPDADLDALSFSQRRLWFLHQLAPTDPAYVLVGAACLAGPLDAERLRAALLALVERHSQMRMTFPAPDGVPRQRLAPPAPPPLSIDDCGALPSEAREAAIQDCADALARAPFDLAAGPLLRLRLLRFAPDDHALVAALHHIVADGESVELLWRDLAAFYAGAPTPPPAADYRTLAARERAAFQARREELLAHWRPRLADPPILDLSGFERPRVPTATPGGSVAFRLPTGLTSRLDSLGEARAATPFMVLLAGFVGLLARVCNQEDLIVGVPVAGRARAEAQGVVGCLVDTLPLRVDAGADPSFAQLIVRTRDCTRDAFANAAPFEALAEVARRTDAPDTALFDALLDYHEPAAEPVVAGALRLSPQPLAQMAAQFSLCLYLSRDGAETEGLLVYRSETIAASAARRLCDAFCTFLAEAVSRPDAPFSTLDIVSAEERAQLDRWNDTAVDLGPPARLDALVAAQARRTPFAAAVASAEGELDYRSLLHAAARVAVWLRSVGIVRGAIVGVQLERSLAMPIALLGILRAGAAYLPLEPDLPAARLSAMIEDAVPSAMIGAEATRPSDLAVPFLDLPKLLAQGDGCAVIPDAPEFGDVEDTAYVIFTSGSTGRPKGVQVSHGAIVNRLRWMQREFGLSPAETVLQKTPFGFDVSVWEFFWPLMVGARLVMVPPGAHRDPDALAAAVETTSASVIHFAPPMLATFLPQLAAKRCSSLRLVISSGEALTPQLRDQFLDCGTSAQLHNLYGPTEAAVDVTHHACRHKGGPVPIGRPIANTRIHILDAAGREAGIGRAGEICIGGIQVAKGYVNQPALTAKRFTPDSFGPRSGRRLYRTGDRGRWNEDGEITYLGRLDDQFKLRGVRVEPAEIEAALLRCAGVRAAAAMLRQDGAAPQIVAFVIGGADAPRLDAAALRCSLAAELPEVMLPSRVIVLAEPPLTRSGKLDRNALARMSPLPTQDDDVESRGDAPLGETEAVVAEAWRTVLNVDAVKRDANFFDSGGDSLLLVRLQLRLKEAFRRDVPLPALYRESTVARQAALFAAPSQPAARAAIAEVAPRPGAGSARAIAVIGMAGRFPGAADVGAYWANLLAGRSGLTRVTRADLVAEGVDSSALDDPDYLPIVGALDDIGGFDAKLFNISRAEAESLDPQSRLLLECAFAALEDAALDPAQTPSDHRVGVFVGGAASGYGLAAAAQALAGRGDDTGWRLLLANDKDFLASRVAYRLGLRGPAISTQTACSSSLVAVQLAVASLRAAECDVALAGGVCVPVPHRVGSLWQAGSILSRACVCRAFDAEADGTIPGSGVGLVVLKPLERALEEGDAIRAVILGGALNNDGAEKVGFAAPGQEGQTRVVRAALADAGVAAESIGYVETHGTGTPLGDQIELTALAQAFPDPQQRPVLGSAKTAIGHADAAAGVAGLIKTVLTLEHGKLPPAQGFSHPNPLLTGEAAGFRLNAAAEPFPARGGLRRAGVSSFGVGGTNAHVVLEAAPTRRDNATPTGTELFVVSANSRTALAERRAQLVEALKGLDALRAAGAARSLQSGRRAMPWRLAVIARDGDEAAARLADAREPEAPVEAPPALTFLFPEPALEAAARAREPRLDRAIDRALAMLDQDMASRVAAALASPGDASPEASALARVALAYATGRLFESWGATPMAAIGIGLGALAAASFAGLCEFAQSLKLALLAVSDAAAFAEAMARMPLRHSRIPLISAETGLPLMPEHTLGAASSAISRLRLGASGVTLAMGSSEALSAMNCEGGSLIFALPSSAEDSMSAGPLPALARLWTGGISLRWEELRSGTRPLKTRLPTYPFEHEHFWRTTAVGAASVSKSAGVDIESPGLADVCWTRLPTQAPGPTRRLRLVGKPRADWAEAAGTLAVRKASTQDEVAVWAAPDGDLAQRIDDLRAAQAEAATLGLDEFVLLTRGAESLMGVERRSPTAAGLIAAARVLMQETPGVDLRLIDVAADAGLDDLVLALDEAARTPTLHSRCALRFGCFWTPALRRLPPEPGPRRTLPRGGVFLVTGAGGRLGRALVARLARDCAPTGFVFVAGPRRTRPDPETADFLAARGTPFDWIAGDATDPAIVKEAFALAAARGRIDGVCHLAGMAGDTAVLPLAAYDRRTANAITRTKTVGAELLTEALAGLPSPPALLMAASSLSGILGGLGFGAYAAGNRAMEAILGPAWLSLAFDGLRFDGEHADLEASTLPIETALDLFEEAFARGLSDVVVVAGDRLETRYARWAEGRPTKRPRAAEKPPEVGGAPLRAADLKALVADAWAKALGDTPAADADFFALGGDSLAAIDICAALKTRTGLTLPVTAVLEARTVARMTELLEALRDLRRQDDGSSDAMTALARGDIEEGEL